MNIDLEALGITRDELQTRVVNKIATEVMRTVASDGENDGEGFETDSDFAQGIQQHVRDAVDAKVAVLATAHVLPNVITYIDGIVLQETNRWGEKTGKSVTLIEYLIERCDAYLREPVDFEGRSQEEARLRGSSWNSAARQTQTRVMHLVHQHLHYSVESAIKQAMAAANASIANGLEEALKIKLAEVSEKIKISVTTK